MIAVPDAEFGEAVMAYVELAPGRTVTADELVEHCRAHIAGYKKPKHVVLRRRASAQHHRQGDEGPAARAGAAGAAGLFEKSTAKLGA